MITAVLTDATLLNGDFCLALLVGQLVVGLVEDVGGGTSGLSRRAMLKDRGSGSGSYGGMVDGSGSAMHGGRGVGRRIWEIEGGGGGCCGRRGRSWEGRWE